MDIASPVRQGPGELLRYCLRSIAAHVPHDQIVIGGHLPDWLAPDGQLVTVPVAQRDSKWVNTKNVWRALCTHPALSEHFLAFNDDFFAMKPAEDIPVMHRGLLYNHWRAHGRRYPHSGYTAGLKAGFDYLASRGIAEPLSYELHIPLPVTKTGYLAALDLCTARMPERSIYGGLYSIGGKLMADVKAEGMADELPGGTWVSCSARTWNSGLPGRRIRAAFPVPSRWERR